MWSADDKFFGATLATKLGVASRKTVVLPNKDYIPAIKPPGEPAQLVFPLDWDAVVRDIGLPCILKDAHGGGWKDVYICRTRDELLAHYNESGFADDDRAGVHRVGSSLSAASASGRRTFLPIHTIRRRASTSWIPTISRRPSATRIVTDSRTLVGALGYDMNSIEFAVKDGVPYAIDFMNPAPDFDINSLTAEYFDWVVQAHGRPGDSAGDASDDGRDTHVPLAGPVKGPPRAEPDILGMTSVLEQAIEHYHELLTDELAGECQAALDAELRASWIVFWRPGVVHRATPRFFTPSSTDSCGIAARSCCGRSIASTTPRSRTRRCGGSSGSSIGKRT